MTVQMYQKRATRNRRRPGKRWMLPRVALSCATVLPTLREAVRVCGGRGRSLSNSRRGIAARRYSTPTTRKPKHLAPGLYKDQGQGHGNDRTQIAYAHTPGPPTVPLVASVLTSASKVL